MALNSGTIFEVQTAGSDSNGGGFRSDSVGTDKTYGASAAATTWTDLVVHASTNTKIKSNGESPRAFDNTDRGNVIQIPSGVAGWTAGFYQITETAMDGSGYMTLDRSPAAAGTTGGTGTLGGALATPGAAMAAGGSSGMTIWVKSGTYTFTTGTANVAGGIISMPGHFLGYNSSRGDNSTTRPVLTVPADGTITNKNVIAIANSPTVIANIEVDGNSQTGITGFWKASGRQTVERCVARNCTTGFSVTNEVFACKAIGCTTGFVGPTVSFCEADSCGSGFTNLFNGHRSIARRCTGAGFAFASDQGAVLNALNCIAYDNDGAGFVLSAAWSAVRCTNCIAVNNGGWGYSATGRLNFCAAYNNTSGDWQTAASNYMRAYLSDTPLITLTGDPFVDGANGDFRLNDTAGAGAALRGAGFDFPAQTDSLDLGAVQHADPAGGGGGGGNRIFGSGIITPLELAG